MIYQTLKLPSPTELCENPQLAALVTLTTALATASVTLLAAYPDLDNRLDGPDPEASHGVEEAYASAIWKQIGALADIVEKYLTAVERRCSLGGRHYSCIEPSF